MLEPLCCCLLEDINWMISFEESPGLLLFDILDNFDDIRMLQYYQLGGSIKLRWHLELPQPGALSTFLPYAVHLNTISSSIYNHDVSVFVIIINNITSLLFWWINLLVMLKMKGPSINKENTCNFSSKISTEKYQWRIIKLGFYFSTFKC